MKKKALSLALVMAVLVSLLTVPASAARGVVTVKVGESAVLRCLEGRYHEWSGGGWGILDIKPRGDTALCEIIGVSPGTATVTVSYKYPIANADPNKWDKEWVSDTMTWTIRVVPADYEVDGTLPFEEPAVKLGTVGEDVSDNIDMIGSYNKYSGLVSVRRDGLWGFANSDMKLIIPFQYDSVVSNDYHPYLEVAIDKDRSDWCWYLIDNAGNYILREGHSGYQVAGDYIYATRVGESRTEELFYKIDGTKISQSEFDRETEGWYRPYDNRLMKGVSPNNLSSEWTFYHTLVDPYVKTTMIEPYAFIINAPEGVDNPDWKGRNRVFSEGVFVVTCDGLQGAIDKNGRVVIPIEYNILKNSSGGYLAYQKGSEFGLLRNPVNPPSGEAVKPSTPTVPAGPAYTAINNALTDYLTKRR